MGQRGARILTLISKKRHALGVSYAFGSVICFSKISLERIAHTEVQGGVLPAQVVYPALARRLVRAVELHTPVEAEDYECDVHA